MTRRNKRPQRVVVTVRCGGHDRDGRPGQCGRELGWLWRKDGELVYSGMCATKDMFLVVTRDWFRLDELAEAWQLGRCARCQRLYGFHPDLIRDALKINKKSIRAPVPDS